MFEEGPYIRYTDDATFLRVCENCRRFVKADDSLEYEWYDNGTSWGPFERLKDQPNATCKRCGRVKMVFEGYCSDEELIC